MTTKGIYSPALRTRTTGTYKAPSAGQHKAMLKAEKSKYKGLTNEQIVRKAKRLGEFNKADLIAAGVSGAVIEKIFGIVDKAKSSAKNLSKKGKDILKNNRKKYSGASPKHRNLTQNFDISKIVSELKSELPRKGTSRFKGGGSIKSKYSKGGGVRSAKYKV
tara:strand:+ start:1382 stop:1867 length:486 start_codon:yes stop_codon:yes gene_type:complete